MTQFLPETQAVLEEAGWTPDRHVDISAWVAQWEKARITAHDTAQRFLREFGGLSIDISGPGISVARAPFKLDPSECIGEDDRYLEWSEELDRSIFPIGILDMGRFYLGIDEYNEIYLIEMWVGSYGRMPEAMDNLITGVRPTVIRELHPASAGPHRGRGGRLPVDRAPQMRGREVVTHG